MPPIPRPFAAPLECGTLNAMARRIATLPGFENLPLLLKVDEVAGLLRVTKRSIYTMVDRGQIPGITKLGGRLRFRRDAIEAWIADSAR
jgi:excisionase family DNA binding protein